MSIGEQSREERDGEKLEHNRSKAIATIEKRKGKRLGEESQSERKREKKNVEHRQK
jgi:hypothetical protein